MEELSPRQVKFYLKWQKRREHKWRFSFLYGSLMWGLSTAVILLLIESSFQVSIYKAILFVLFYMIVGFWSGYKQFEKNEKEYLKIIDDTEINRGVKILEIGTDWIFENLIISFSDDVVVVRNNIMWTANTDDLLKSIRQDIERLKKNANFNAFVGNKSIKIRVYDDVNATVPLKEEFL